MRHSSGIGVLDKAVLVLRQAASSPVTLAELVEQVALPKATVHRIAVALESHGLLRRNESGAWVPGLLLTELAAEGEPNLVTRANPILAQLCRDTGESAQLFERAADARVCTAVAERASGLRDTVPLGARLPMTAGSAAHVLLAWSTGNGADAGVLDRASFSSKTLAEVRRLGYAHSSAEREAGVASTSAPVRDSSGNVLAAVSVSGPVGRLGRRAEPALVAAVLEAARTLSG
ncbi:MAG: helix-turn-helix domain-containing protein [Geodermatophilaceae bacterium]|nr:helix-turn-helix domain-containing protein [Geodermatophilaceae bacterium]